MPFKVAPTQYETFGFFGFLGGTPQNHPKRGNIGFGVFGSGPRSIGSLLVIFWQFRPLFVNFAFIFRPFWVALGQLHKGPPLGTFLGGPFWVFGWGGLHIGFFWVDGKTHPKRATLGLRIFGFVGFRNG